MRIHFLTAWQTDKRTDRETFWNWIAPECADGFGRKYACCKGYFIGFQECLWPRNIMPLHNSVSSVWWIFICFGFSNAKLSKTCFWMENLRTWVENRTANFYFWILWFLLYFDLTFQSLCNFLSIEYFC